MYSRPRFWPFYSVAVVLLLITVVLAAVTLHMQMSKSSRENNHPTGNARAALTTSTGKVPSMGSGVVVLTTASTSTSGFSTIVFPVTKTEYANPIIVNQWTTEVLKTSLRAGTSMQITSQSAVSGISSSTGSLLRSLSQTTLIESTAKSVTLNWPLHLTANNFIRAEPVNKTLPLSRRRLRPTGDEATNADV